MAYDFTAASSQYLTTTSTPISSGPFTISAFGRIATTGSVKTLVSIESGNSNILYQLYVSSSQQLSFESHGASGINNILVTSPLVSVNTFFHAAAVVNSATSRSLILNGSTKTSNAVANIGTTSVNRINIGSRYFSGALGGYQNGLIAEIGIWNAALTDAEIASLAKGMTPDKIRPQNLVFYAPLVRNLIDQKGGLALTNNNGATVANHPRVYA